MKTNKLSLAIATVLSLGTNSVQAQFSAVFELSDINGSNGFVIHGENHSDLSGRSVSSAGDVNGDGIDDVIIGAPYAGQAGISYVIFGSSTGLTNPLDLSNINGSNGFVIHGENSGDSSGLSVSSAGDVNGDGIDDVIVGAFRASPNGDSEAGSSYVIFGSSTVLANPLYLSNINGSNGFVIQGRMLMITLGFL